MKIQDMIALVTGANRGIGSALVQSLLQRGARKVYATVRRAADFERVARMNLERVVPLCLDVTNHSQLRRAAQQAGDVQVLFNNAGALEIGSVLEAEPEAFRRILDVNFFGVLHATRAFAPALERHHGAVVNILTVVALASMPRLGVYNASKAAAWSLTQSLRADLRKKSVKVFSVFPGPVDTDMTRHIDMPKTSPAAVAEAILNGIANDTEDIFPDPMSQQLYAQWTSDHKSVEQQFATM